MDDLNNDEGRMTNPEYRLTIDTSQADILHLTLTDDAGAVVAEQKVPLDGYVDNILLTAVDKLLNSSNIDKSALKTVSAGQGIDKNSSLYRIVISFATAVAAAHGAAA